MSIVGSSLVVFGIIAGLWGLKIGNNPLKLGAVLLLVGGFVLVSADTLLRPEDFGTVQAHDSP